MEFFFQHKFTHGDYSEDDTNMRRILEAMSIIINVFGKF